jgi:hypothetical protein
MVVWAVEVSYNRSSLDVLGGLSQYGGDVLDPSVFYWRNGVEES